LRIGEDGLPESQGVVEWDHPFAAQPDRPVGGRVGVAFPEVDAAGLQGFS
jgi:hypothetical protein